MLVSGHVVVHRHCISSIVTLLSLLASYKVLNGMSLKVTILQSPFNCTISGTTVLGAAEYL